MFAHKEDCTIEDCGTHNMDSLFDGKKVLLDEDGKVLWLFDGEVPDKFIWDALEFANSFHGDGIELGEKIKANQIKNILGI